MRQSKMLAKFRAGAFARVCSMGHVLPFFIRYAAHYGYDGIWLDLEHRNMTSREVQYLDSALLLQRYRLHGAPANTRIHSALSLLRRRRLLAF